MTAKDLRALLKAENLRREDLALFLGVDPKKPVAWERGEEPITSENAKQIHKVLAEYREARTSLQAHGLWVPVGERDAEGDTRRASGIADIPLQTVHDSRGARERAGAGPSTPSTSVRPVQGTVSERRPVRGGLIGLWGALRSSFLEGTAHE